MLTRISGRGLSAPNSSLIIHWCLMQEAYAHARTHIDIYIYAFIGVRLRERECVLTNESDGSCMHACTHVHIIWFGGAAAKVLILDLNFFHAKLLALLVDTCPVVDYIGALFGGCVWGGGQWRLMIYVTLCCPQKGAPIPKKKIVVITLNFYHVLHLSFFLHSWISSV